MKRRSRKVFIIGIVFLLIAGACAAPAAPTPTPGPLDLVKTFQDTFNKGDPDGFLALFVDKPYWDVVGGLWEQFGFARSVKAVRNYLEFFFAIHQQITLSACKVENGSVSCKMTMKDDCMPPGVDVIPLDIRFELKNDKVSSVVGKSGSPDQVAYDYYSSQIYTWAKQNLPDDSAKYNSEAEWTKFTATGDQGGGKLSATEYGQVRHRLCTGYAKATK
jgi:hypothetical protein